jgi:hypothetical protein
MTGTGSHRIALMCASLASGPLYLLGYAAGSMVYSVPQPIIVRPQDVVNFLLLLVPGTIAGFFVAIVPLVFAILILSGMASSSGVARRPLVWAAAGGTGGALIGWAAGWDDPVRSFAFIFSASASLRIARAYLAWPPPEPLFLPPDRIIRRESATPH